jgi:hypothetical protein
MGVMNSHLRDLLGGLEARYPDDATTMAMSTWLERNTRLRKTPFSFYRYEFQRRIADDLHPNMSVMKPSQIGLSELQLRKFLGMLKRTTSLTGIYTLPNEKMRDRISQTRIKPLVDSESVFNGPTQDKPVRHKGLYQIDDSFGYVTGSTEGDATSIAADFLFHDEIDLTDDRLIGLFQSRLQGSSYRITQRFSTPTFFGAGIDATYSASDQHEYVHRCHGCGHYQIPTFHPKFLHLPGLVTNEEDLTQLADDEIDQINMEKSYVCCERCSRQLNLQDSMSWQWVATYPSRSARGYRVRPFNVPHLITVPYIFQQLQLRRQQGDIQGFHNTVLGEPYNDSKARIAEVDIIACMGSEAEQQPASGEPLGLGIDVGIICHIVLGTPSRTLRMWQVHQSVLIETIRGILDQYGNQIVAGCIDRHPYTPTAEEIRDFPDHPKKIMPVVYAPRSTPMPLNLAKDDFDEPSFYSVDRTRALDTVARLVRTRKVKFEGFGIHRQLVVDHLRGMVRIETKETTPIWKKITKEDHFFHALGYLFLAFRMRDVSVYRSDVDPRTNWFLMGSNVYEGGEVSLHSTRPKHKVVNRGH